MEGCGVKAVPGFQGPLSVCLALDKVQSCLHEGQNKSQCPGFLRHILKLSPLEWWAPGGCPRGVVAMERMGVTGQQTVNLSL